jgi:hypothetical protein
MVKKVHRMTAPRKGARYREGCFFLCSNVYRKTPQALRNVRKVGKV